VLSRAQLSMLLARGHQDAFDLPEVGRAILTSPLTSHRRGPRPFHRKTANQIQSRSLDYYLPRFTTANALETHSHLKLTPVRAVAHRMSTRNRGMREPIR
jgi:hypothetical protein